MVEALVLVLLGFLGLVVLAGLPVLVLVLIARLFGNQAKNRLRLENLEGQLLDRDKAQATWWLRIEALEDQVQQVDQRLAELILSLQGLELDLPRLDPARFDLATLDPAPFDPTKFDLAREQDQPSRPLPQSSRLRGPGAEPELPPQGAPEAQAPAIPGAPWTPAPALGPVLAPDGPQAAPIPGAPPAPAPTSAQARAPEPPASPTPAPPPPSAPNPTPAASSEPLRPAASVPEVPASAAPQTAKARPALSRRPSAPVAPSRPRPGVAASSPQRRPEPTPLQLFWRRLERLVVANWTGILGVVMVVAGVSFVTINMALAMGPQARFWLTVAAAAVLVVPHLLWGQRDPWQNLTAWMRSGGAALFLFACSAAGGVPDLGLTWQRDPGGALALLVLGGLANLLVALVARSQTIAALHAVLTLVPLMIAAPSGLTLGLGSLVAVVSLLLPLRRPWHGQRLVACLAYGCFQLTWVARSGEALELASPGGPSLRWLAAAAAIAVFGCGVLLPHLGLAQAPTAGSAAGAPEGRAAAGDTPGAGRAAMPLQLLGLLSNWSGLGLALFLYPQTPGLRFGGLVLGWAAATLLARRTPRASRPWLGRCDTLVGQALAIAALLSLLGPIANGPLLVFALFLEAVLFVRLGLDRSDPWIGLLGWGLMNLGGFGLLLTVLDQVAVPGPGALAGGANPLAIAQQNRVLLLAASAMTIAVQAHLHRRPPDPRLAAEPAPALPAAALSATTQAVQALPIPPLLGWLAAALAFGAAWCCGPAGWQELVALLGLGALLLLGRRRSLPGLLNGSATAIVVSYGVSWIGWAALPPLDSFSAQASQVLPHLLPLLALGLVMAASTSGSRRRGAILLIGFTAALGAFHLSAPLPPLALAAAWLGLGLVALVIAPRLPRQEASDVLVLGLLDLLGASAIAIAQHPSSHAGQATVLLLAASALALAFQRQISRLEMNGPMEPLLGWLAVALAFSAAWWGAPAGWQEPVALLGLGPLVLLNQRRPLPGLVNGSATAIVVSHGISWVTLAAGHPWSAATLWPPLLALLALGLVLAFGTSGKLQLLAIDLIGISTALGAFLLVAPLSPLAPAVAWLGLSLLALGAAHRLGEGKATHALILGLVALLIAGVWGLAGGPGAELGAFAGFAIPARVLVDGSGLGVVLVWWRWQASPQLAETRLWKTVHPLMVEAFLLGTLITVALEVPGPWWPVAWSLLALGLLSPGLGRLLAPRIKLYSVVLQWLAIGAVVTSSLSPIQGWEQSLNGPIGLLAIAIQVLYVVASHRWLVLAGPGAGGSSGTLARFAAALGRHRNRALYYPLFLGMALDLASRYDHSVLTLLWATQAFVLFGLSALLRDNQFRYLALVGLGGCLLRLVAVDMRQADLGLRGLVFIGVGLLMLAMNALYNRFRSRFE